MATCGSLIYTLLLMRFLLISKIATLTDCAITKLQTQPTFAQFPHSQHSPTICPQMCFRPSSRADEKMTEGRVFEVRDVNDLLGFSSQPRTIKTQQKLWTSAVIDLWTVPKPNILSLNASSGCFAIISGQYLLNKSDDIFCHLFLQRETAPRDQLNCMSGQGVKEPEFLFSRFCSTPCYLSLPILLSPLCN